MNEAHPAAGEVIAALGLEPHPEGGFFRETFRAVDLVEAVQGRRVSATSIAFLLTVDRPSRFHRLLSDELWVHQGGAPLELWLLEPDGSARRVLLGLGSGDPRPAARPTPRFPAGSTAGSTASRTASPTARVPAHVWQAARVLAAPSARDPTARDLTAPDLTAPDPTAREPTALPALDWSLVTCVVTPGFEYADFELGRRDVLLAGWPEVAGIVAELTGDPAAGRER